MDIYKAQRTETQMKELYIHDRLAASHPFPPTAPAAFLNFIQAYEEIKICNEM
jgi:hypothetical protein